MNTKKLGIIVLCIGVLFLFSSIIFIVIFKGSETKPKEYKELKWENIQGDIIHTEYDEYTNSEYKTYKFNLDTQEINNSFSIDLPKNITLYNMDKDLIEYKKDNVSFTITRTSVQDLKSEEEIIKQGYTQTYEKVNIKTTEYDKNIFAFIIESSKYNDTKTEMYFNQEIRIYIKANDYDEYVLLKITTFDKRIDLDMISKIINSIVINKKEIKFCDDYKCEANLNIIHDSLNNTFNLKLPKDKYVLENNYGLNIFNASFITKEYQKVQADEENGIKKYTKIDLRFVYNDDSYLDTLPYQEEIEIEGKKILKSYYKNNVYDNIEYNGTYIYQTDNKVLVIIDIDSRVDNVEEVLKDFIKFTIK